MQSCPSYSPAMVGDVPSGFWSYTHRDNDLDGGRIIRLAEAIGNEFELITGEELQVFVDNKSIAWGDLWRIRIDSALDSIAFLIPVLTPRFFKSQECRKEVLTFAIHAANVGLDDLLLPIHYVDVPRLFDNPGGDEVMALVAQRQIVDWRSLRLEAEDSPKYRKAIHDLAIRLSVLVEEALAVETPPLSAAVDSDQTPGFIEAVAEAEVTMPKWSQTVEQLSAATEEIGSHLAWATSEFSISDTQGKGFAGRLNVTRELSARLEEPIRRTSELGAQYLEQLSAIDPGILELIRVVGEGGLDEEDASTARDFLETVKGLASSSTGAMVHIGTFADGIRDSARNSRELRPLMNKLLDALQKVLDGTIIMDEWVRSIDRLGDI